MIKVIIYGAGSIGNHLAYACRNKNWSVTMVDADPEALIRTNKDIYPSRYGFWDKDICLNSPESIKGKSADLVIIGTPPDTHMEIALDVIHNIKPRVLLIEKPLCTPDLEGYQEVFKASKEAKVVILTGYNHTLAMNTLEAERILKTEVLGKPLSVKVRWQEHWGGIFSAHPWLNGPTDTYLGFSVRGGGACGEHSHGINLFQHFARILGIGRIAEVSATMDRVKQDGADYDRICLINVVTEAGLVGSISQDVITKPAIKTLRVQGIAGFLEWYANYDNANDAIIWGTDNKEPEKILIPKKRPDDFKNEIDEVENILNGKIQDSAISLNAGYETMQVISAAYRSDELKSVYHINY